MAEAGNAPILMVCRFHRDHNTPWNRQPPGQLHHDTGVQSLGFLRGNNLAVGQKIHVQTSDGKKVWDGSLSQSVNDNYTPTEGPAWFFAVTCTKYEPDPDAEDTVIVTVTVTNSTNGTGSITAQPNPQDVP